MLFSKKLPVSWLIVGLGNPGDKYDGTRHNAGFWAVDALAEHYYKPMWTPEGMVPG